MKLSWRQIEPFVKSPDPAARVILVYGPDDGLMRERARIIGLTVVTDYNDPFNVAIIDGNALPDDPAKLSDEANAISMMGGGRLVRVENAADKIAKVVEDYLQNPSIEALVVLEAGDLGPRSKLRSLCEKAKNAAALPCYVEDERDLSKLIREMTGAANMRIDSDATGWLAMNISGNRQKARSEIEKLILYKSGETSSISLEDARACCGEAGAQSLDDLVFNTASRNSAKALRAYNLLLEEDVNFIVIIRSLQNHFRRLHATKARLESGHDIDSAMKKLSPPVFFKQADSFKSQLQRWSLPALESILSKLMEIEAQCKQTAMPAETLCAQAILGISKSR